MSDDGKVTVANGGHGPDGRFVRGCPPGPGSRYARKVAALRRAYMGEVKPDDLRKAARALITLAVGGDVAALRLLFDRCLGAVEALDLLARVEALESRKV